MSDSEQTPPELLRFFKVEREAPGADSSVRVALRERLATSFTLEAPPGEVMRARVRGGELARATAQEPMAAPPASGRTKGKMNIFDKRIGAAALLIVAVGLFGATLYERRIAAKPPDQGLATPSQYRRDEPTTLGPQIDLGRSFSETPRSLPVAPTTGADLAITAGESAWIHVPFGAVDIEIQSKCNAEVELWVATALHRDRGEDRWHTEKGGDEMVVVGVDAPDGKASTYHLTPGLDPSMYEYTSRCVGQPYGPLRGNFVIDRNDARDAISVATNARVYSNNLMSGLRVFGAVLPGARVSIGAKSIPLGPPDPTGYDLPIFPTFATDVPVSPQHVTAALRVDDAKGVHFYVVRKSTLLLREQCANRMTVPKRTAETLDANGDHVGALSALEAGMADCKPDRDTLSLALTYACRAHDAEAAKKYWRKLPAELQRSLESLCAQNQISREALEKP